MNIALIGSGGREHAICQKLNESPLTKNIYCIPGNAGTEKITKNLNFDPLNFKKLLLSATSNNCTQRSYRSLKIISPHVENRHFILCLKTKIFFSCWAD